MNIITDATNITESIVKTAKMFPTTENTRLEDLYVSEPYRTVESIRVFANCVSIAEYTINLTPLHIKLPTILPNSIYANCEILIM